MGKLTAIETDNFCCKVNSVKEGGVFGGYITIIYDLTHYGTSDKIPSKSDVLAVVTYNDNVSKENRLSAHSFIVGVFNKMGNDICLYDLISLVLDKLKEENVGNRFIDKRTSEGYAKAIANISSKIKSVNENDIYIEDSNLDIDSICDKFDDEYGEELAGNVNEVIEFCHNNKKFIEEYGEDLFLSIVKLSSAITTSSEDLDSKPLLLSLISKNLPGFIDEYGEEFAIAICCLAIRSKSQNVDYEIDDEIPF